MQKRFALAGAVSLSLAAAILAMSAATAFAAGPAVIRTMTHHQITSLPQGIWRFILVVSDSGNRIVYSINPPAPGQQPQLAIIDFGGGNARMLDNTAGISHADITADGSVVVYVVGHEIRSIRADGTNRRSLFKIDDGDISCIRITGDGSMIYFLSVRGMTINSAPQPKLERGIYAMNADGTNFHHLVGPDEIAKLLGVNSNDVGTNNFTLLNSDGTLDVSTLGTAVAFGCFVKSASVLFGCDGQGNNLHTIIERNVQSGGYVNQFTTIALSNDGKYVAYRTAWPDEVGVVDFLGRSPHSLLKGDANFNFGSADPIYITADGSRVLYRGREFSSAGSGYFDLITTHQASVLKYLDDLQIAMDTQGRRYSYWIGLPNQAPQLAAMELNVALGGLGAAPRITQLALQAPAIPRQTNSGSVTAPALSARVDTSTPPVMVTSSVFFNGVYDRTFGQDGSLTMTYLYDDGKTQFDGDLVANDGIFTRRWLAALPTAPDGPRTVRVEAQVTGADKMQHGQVVEIGTFPIVTQPPTGTMPPIAGTPPPQPSATIPPAAPIAGPGRGGTPAGPGPGGATPPGGVSRGGSGVSPTPPAPASPTGTPAAPPAPTPIDLTGYWKTEAPGIYYLRQIGSSLYWSGQDMPHDQNVFVGHISGSTITGSWIDLPGGATLGSGDLTLTIDSDDKLTKTAQSASYEGSIWTRVGSPPTSGTPGTPGTPGAPGTSGTPAAPAPGSGGGATSGGPGGSGPSPAIPAAPPPPWATVQGQAAIDQWISLAMSKLNAFNGDAQFNSEKPYSINKYGLLEGRGFHSVAAPDDFSQFGNNKYEYMWHYWVPSASTGWSLPYWNAAGIPPLHDYVMGIVK